LCRPD
jgi:hypothetical protein